jgi:hypothetical protein
MTVQEAIVLLRSATQPSRRLDVVIAELAGWMKQIQWKSDSAPGQTQEKVVWRNPDTNQPGKIPFYTSDLQHALEFAEKYLPHHVGACSWEDGKGVAQINDDPRVEAINPQIALCIAVLTKFQ